MAISISLSDLLNFQQRISNDSVFTNVKQDYDWYKASCLVLK